ncbi:hypothetical protein AB0L65_32740 [Nonomuraea sp. NPDC052116]|uniref:hypothetical protein n=1 Tax=Nonomuraea sp. NPDC052116 TaxID=3155665 RepID=UPI00343E6542
MTYLPGETVRVTMTGKVGKVVPGVEEGDWDELSLDLDDDQGGMAVRIPLGWVNTRIERLVPAAGMPKPGEVWQDRNEQRYFVVVDAYGNPKFMTSKGSQYPVADILLVSSPLTPLIQDPEPESARAPSVDEEVSW